MTSSDALVVLGGLATMAALSAIPAAIAGIIVHLRERGARRG